MTEFHAAALASATTERCCPIVDLRQYTLFPGTRDEFIELFDRELVETQEAVGMRVIGQFRDLGDPNRFVWMRGYADMRAREKGLTSFYVQGETWRRYGERARSCMIDSNDALLLHPALPDAAFLLEPSYRRPPLDSQLTPGLVIATLWYLPRPVDSDFIAFFDMAIKPAIMGAGGRVLGLLATEHSPNNFPRLPLREGENVVALFQGFGSAAEYHHYLTTLGKTSAWRSEIYPHLIERLWTPPQVLRLAPTSRSQLRA